MCDGYPLPDGRFQAVHGLGNDTTRTGGIEAHEACAFLAKHGAIVQGEVGLVDDERAELLLREAQLAEVEEHEIGGLGAYHFIVSLALAKVYGIAQATGVVFATISHEAQALVMILCGAVSLISVSMWKKSSKHKL